MTAPIASVFNDAYVAEQYEAYRRDPASVDESFRQLFRLAESLAAPSGAPAGAGAAPAADASLLRAVAGAAALVDAVRHYGHLAVQLDPLGTPPVGAAELTPEFHGITEADLGRVPAAALGFEEEGSAADVVARLRRLYGSTMGFEFEHIEEEAEREWFRRTIESGEAARPLSPDEAKAVLRRLTEVDGLERFLGRAFVGVKRFSIEGTDALVPMLDAAIEGAGRAGAREVVMGMAHRGRLNVLTHVVGKPYSVLFGEFEGRHLTSAADTGDVKYHMGYESERDVGDGRRVKLTLLPNPSHLEFVNPVINGVARARQRTAAPAGSQAAGGADAARTAAGAGAPTDERSVLTICIHGDAAFIGEGVVAETFNMSRLRGYRVGGTLHIIANNQVGFTTDPIDARSTYYASDLAKGFEVPVVHVNGDDAAACVAAVRLGIAYRERFGKDFLIDLVGYRRHGHNETDEPVWTQPTLYGAIKQHPSPREVWGRRLVAEGVVTADEVQAIDREFADRLSRILDEVKGGAAHEAHGTETSEGEAAPPPMQIDTAVKAETLAALNERLLALPADFRGNPRLVKQLERRRQNLESAIDWGHAEALAFGTLLIEGHSVRISGQDVERGTFSHRQDVLHDMESGATFIPLQHLAPLAAGRAPGRFEIYNSPLSETAVMGFEYGYSVAAPDTLTLWEAQFGDFVNVAQPIIDQFLTADRAKWGQDSGLVLLLPHGYEGQGPEHSSARLERFLQLSAEGNLVVAYPSTPAQYFHVLRRQAKRRTRRPLVLMQPKSLLRLPEAASGAQDLAAGGFRPVLDDPVASQRREQVRRLVFCTGKLYYDLSGARAKAGEGAGGTGDAGAVALVRIEELYPYPHDEVARIVDLYPALEEVVWAQEEPKNMGAWTYLAPRLRASTGTQVTVRYIGRPERASPAEGYAADHTREQGRIVGEVLAAPQPAKRGAAARS